MLRCIQAHKREGGEESELRLHVSVYPIGPKGLGTAGCESIASLCRRIAFAHRVTPTALMTALKSPKIRGSNSPMASRSLAINLGARWDHLMMAELLREASGVPEVMRCTLQPLVSVLPIRVNASQRVCPVCIQEGAIGERFNCVLWQIAFVEACPLHRVRLVAASGCSYPNPLPVKQRPDVPGVCRICGSIGFKCLVGTQKPPGEVECWVAAQVGVVIATLSAECHSISATTIEKGVTHLREVAMTRQYEMRCWNKRVLRPQPTRKTQLGTDLFQVTAVCLRLGFDLNAVLHGQLVRADAPAMPAGYFFTSVGVEPLIAPYGPTLKKYR